MKNITQDSIKMPAHYTGHPSGIEPKQFLGWFPHFIGCAIKYLWRAGLKDGNTVEQDLLKAREYIDFELERIRAKQPEKKLYEKSWEGFCGRYGCELRNRVSYRNRKGKIIFWTHHPGDGLADAFKGLESLKSICVDVGPVHLIGKKVRNSYDEYTVKELFRCTSDAYSWRQGEWCVRYTDGDWDFVSSVKLVEEPDFAPEGKCWTWGKGGEALGPDNRRYRGFKSKKAAKEDPCNTDGHPVFLADSRYVQHVS